MTVAKDNLKAKQARKQAIEKENEPAPQTNSAEKIEAFTKN